MKELFAIGQAVTLNRRVQWVGIEGDNPNPKPQFGKIYHCGGYDEYKYGCLFMFIKECHPEDSFPQHYFSAVVDDSVVEEELKEVLELTLQE